MAAAPPPKPAGPPPSAAPGGSLGSYFQSLGATSTGGFNPSAPGWGQGVIQPQKFYDPSTMAPGPVPGGTASPTNPKNIRKKQKQAANQAAKAAKQAANQQAKQQKQAANQAAKAAKKAAPPVIGKPVPPAPAPKAKAAAPAPKAKAKKPGIPGLGGLF